MKHKIMITLCILSTGLVHAAPAKILDALRWEESHNKNHEVNHNRNGTKDCGPFQLNSQYLDYFAWKYNKGKKINPFNERESRRVASDYLDDLQTFILGNHLADARFKQSERWYEIIQAWNCGLSQYLRGSTKTSRALARRVLERAGYGRQ